MTTTIVIICVAFLVLLVAFVVAAKVAKPVVPAEAKERTFYFDDRVKVAGDHSHFYAGATGTVTKWSYEFGYMVQLDRPHDCSEFFQPWSLEPFVDEEAAAQC